MIRNQRNVKQSNGDVTIFVTLTVTVSQNDKNKKNGKCQQLVEMWGHGALPHCQWVRWGQLVCGGKHIAVDCALKLSITVSRSLS